MKIEDLIELLNNRLREFQLSRDYARMNGDLERMNIADKEILALEDTLFKLNLLIDTSKSAAVKEEILAEVITDGSVAVLDEYDITPYATDPLHERKIMNILSKMGVMDTVEKIDKYIKSKSLGSPVTGEMVISGAEAYDVDVRLMMAIMEQDSHFGIFGVAVRTLNPGNVGNDDDGNIRAYESWQEGVTAVAEWLSRHRGSTIMPETSPEIIIEPVATSTPSIIMPTATSTPLSTSTSTPIVTTSTTTTITNLPTTATSTPATTSTTTPVIATSTPATTPTTTPVTPNQDSSGSSGTGQATTSTTTTPTPEPTPEPEPESIPEPDPEPETEPTLEDTSEEEQTTIISN